MIVFVCSILDKNTNNFTGTKNRAKSLATDSYFSIENILYPYFAITILYTVYKSYYYVHVGDECVFVCVFPDGCLTQSELTQRNGPKCGANVAERCLIG